MRNHQPRPPRASSRHPGPKDTQRRLAASGPKQRRTRDGRTRLFATAVPGLTPLVSRELAGLPGVTVTDVGFDGRADLVLFEAERGTWDALSPRTTEDLFAEVGRTLRAEGDNPRWIARRVWRPERVGRALSAWANRVHPLSAAMTFRVIARVLQERSFLRTELRRQFSRAIADDRPKWRIADPAQIEVWVSEYRRGQIVAGLRLSDARMRQHEGRVVERSGALRPTVAAAMVSLAGEPSGVLLDPCCGSGTILTEAIAAGWKVEGVDIDPAAVEAAQRNVPRAEVRPGDARHLGMPDSSVDACVSNLPFGQQYEVQGDMRGWLTVVLAEMTRITRPGGRVVVLAPQIPPSCVPAELRMRERFRIKLLGVTTTIWAYDRA